MDLLKEIQETIAKIQTLYPDHMIYGLSPKFTTCLPLEFSTRLEKLKDLADMCGYEKKNNHYISCPWSNSNCVCGPDTCQCAMASFYYFELKRMIAVFVKQHCPDYDGGETKADGKQQ